MKVLTRCLTSGDRGKRLFCCRLEQRANKPDEDIRLKLGGESQPSASTLDRHTFAVLLLLQCVLRAAVHGWPWMAPACWRDRRCYSARRALRHAFRVACQPASRRSRPRGLASTRCRCASPSPRGVNFVPGANNPALACISRTAPDCSAHSQRWCSYAWYARCLVVHGLM